MRSYRLIILSILFCIVHTQTNAQVVINEFLSSNTWTNVDSRDYWGYSDWIELYNAGPADVDLSGYSITDNPGDPPYFFADGTTIEAGDYLIVWADGQDKVPGDRDTIQLNFDIPILIRDHHADFKLSSEGETLMLFDTSGLVIDSITYGKQLGDVSFGRRTDDMEQWAWFGSPTLGNANSTIASTAVEFATDVTHSPQGGQFIGSQLISLSSASGETIRYTTDGSVPNESSELYSAPILVSTPTVIKARSFKDDAIAGPVSSHSYLINTTSTLPSISVSTNPQDLWNLGYGIYANSYKDREIPVNVEYFDANGIRQFEVGAGAELFGSNIFFLGQKPLSFTMKNKYGDDKLQYPLFDERGQVLYDDFVLRNGGNDNGLTFFRDALVMTILKGEMDLDYQAFQPCAVYLNGDYWGLYNLRERLNDDYLLYTHDVNPLDVDILEDNSDLRTGDDEAWNSYFSFLENNSLSDPANYEYAVSQIDLDSYMDYKILKIFIGYRIDDVNLKYWKEPIGQWRWIAFDLEHAFGRLTSDTCEANTLQTVSSTGGQLPDWSTLMFRRFLENDGFKEAFVNRFISHMNSTFENDRLLEIIDELTALYQPEMGKHINRWDSDPLAIPDLPTWLANIQELKDYVLCRPDEVYMHLMELLEADETYSLSVNVPGRDTAIILVNGVDVDPGMFTSEYPAGTEIEVVSITQHGYEMTDWQSLYYPETVVFELNNDTLLTPGYIQDTSIIILKDTLYNDLTFGPETLDSIYIIDDLVIDSFVTMEIIGGNKIIFMADHANIVVHGRLILEYDEPTGYPLIIADPDPAGRRPYNNSDPGWGAITVKNATGRSELTGLIYGSSYGRDRYREKASVNSFNSKILLSSYIPNAVQPFYSEFGEVVIRSAGLSSDLSGDLINVKYADSVLIENCILLGNMAEDMDAIDLDGVNGGVVRQNFIQDFLGPNSDGIDLGESATNVIIEWNSITNCSDKGISVGQQSTVKARHNVIANCAQGYGIKDDGSHADIDHHTFYANDYAVAVFEKNAGDGGGSADITNTILSKSVMAPILSDAMSTTTVEYSLAETPLPVGEGNLQGEPLFRNASLYDFNLRAGSPCIDSGDPDFENDIDGSRTDMGAYYADLDFQPSFSTDMIITEVNYNSGDCGMEDWVELRNMNLLDRNISGWQLTDGENYFTIPEGTIIQYFSYMVLCRDLDNFRSRFPDVPAVGNFDFGLSNGGEQLTLLNKEGEIRYSFTYDDRHPWPRGADGYCNTMELMHRDYDPSLGINWHASYHPYGTPGADNSEVERANGLSLNEFMASNNSTLQDPYGEYDDWIEIFNNRNDDIDIGGLYITDDMDDLFKWRIPRTNTEISLVEDKNFNLLWADGQPDQGTMHLDFKLSASGEDLALVQVLVGDTVILDHYSFGPQTPDTTFGQYTDGLGNWQIMMPTPLAPNQLIVSVIEEVLNSKIKVYPNPASDFIYLDMGDLEEVPDRILVTDISGRKMIDQPGAKTQLDLRSLAPSTYFLILEFDDVRIGRKIVVR